MTTVFLSSTSKDLIQQRDAVYKAIEGLDSFHCVRMEDFGARDVSPGDFCRQKITECELFICLVGLCYGSISPDSEESYTASEYHIAGESGIPRLVFVSLDEDYYSGMYREVDTQWDKQQKFRQEVGSKCIRETFTDPSILALRVIKAIRNWERSRESPPIVQPDYFDKYADTPNLPFDQLPSPNATFADLHLDKIHAFFKRDLVRRQEDFLQGKPDLDNLVHFGLLKGSHPIQGTLLCFGENPQVWFAGAITRCIHWRGNNTRSSYHTDRNCRGDLLAQLESSLDFLRTYLKFSRLIGRGDRTEQYEIPMLALQEAIANALVHREYASRRYDGKYEVRTDCVQIEIFDERIEIKSPGSLPAPLTLESLQIEHMTHPRNLSIATIFYLYGQVERAGTGIQRMRDAMEEVGLPPPRFEISRAGNFKVILERPRQVPDEILISKAFGDLLVQGLDAIALKKKHDIQSLLEEKKVFSEETSFLQVQEWRKGRVPNSPGQIATLARTCVEYGDMDQPWVYDFLTAAHYPQPEALVTEIFTQKTLESLKRSQRNTRTILISLISVLTVLIIVFTTIFSRTPQIINACVSGTLNISGSSLLFPLIRAAAQSYSTKCPGASISTLSNSSLAGLQGLEEGITNIGASDISASDIAVSSVYKDLVDHQIAVTTFALVVNKDVLIANLTTAQIQAIYQRSIMNWSEVGGPDLPITLVDRPVTSATRLAFDRYVLVNSMHIESDHVAPSSQQVVGMVQGIPGAIGYVDLPTAQAAKGLKMLSIDEITPISASVKNNSYKFWSIEHLYTKGLPASNSLSSSFLAYMAGKDAQKNASTLGFIPFNDISSAAIITHSPN